jgi:hypothetical protein
VNNTNTTNTDRFSRWLDRVNTAMLSDYGFGIDDIEDYDYYTCWEDGQTPSNAAYHALVRSGYNDSVL